MMSNHGLQVLAEACKTRNEGSIETINTKDEESNSLKNTSFHPTLLHCKARGTPLDHQEERALLNFDIGEEYKHGADMRCTHPICRQSGVKFRYCSFCKKAVAKRNFRKRHAHNDFATSAYIATGDVNELSNELHLSLENTKHPPDLPCLRKHSMEMGGKHSNSNNQPLPLFTDDEHQRIKVQRIQPKVIQRHPPLQAIDINLNHKRSHHQYQQQLSGENDKIAMKNPMQENKLQGSERYTCAENSNTSLSSNKNFNETNNPTILSTTLSHCADMNLYDVPSKWIDLYRMRPSTDSYEKDFHDWISEVCEVAGQRCHLNKFSPTAIATKSPKSLYDSGSIDVSQLENMSSSALNHYDKVRKEFKGIIPPRFDKSSSLDVLGAYRQYAESLSLSINTDFESLTSPSMMMLDSEGSKIMQSMQYTFDNISAIERLK